MSEIRTMFEEFLKNESGDLNIFGKLVKIILIFIIIKLITKYVSNFIDRTLKNKALNHLHNGRRANTIGNIIKSVVKYFLYFVWIIIILEMFEVNTSSIIATAGIGGLAIGFGAQSLVKDIITGFFILFEDQYSVGDYVTIGSYDGMVEEMGLRVTKLRAFNGDLHIIPNSTIQVVSNSSRGNMRALVRIAIPHDEDMDRALEVMEKACDQVKISNENILEGPNVLGISDITETSVIINIVAKTEPMWQWSCERQIRKAIKDAFERENIDMAYPKLKIIGGGKD